MRVCQERRRQALSNGQIKTLIASHVGLNPEVAHRMNTDVAEDKLECILVPQGTLAERVRAGGAGSADPNADRGWYHCSRRQAGDKPQWKGLSVRRTFRAEYAFIRGSKTDTFGNTVYNGTTRTFNPMMATAADHVIVGTCEIVEIGEIDPNNVVTSRNFRRHNRRRGKAMQI